ncbi:Glucosamine kinase GspK [Pseudoalteromonas holothuriae]|uniref:Glucosamine kinase GspK n=1 Tax=Pseudoalteromonas holothuriae TaxID=2963714 RepID=A0A9W4QRW9_9GAMM|nr:MULTISPECIES: BadF/BadG/BcrA/BcrD ATPase family protein [unclassified Pseudoalteromonas]CAH9050516.1 Glucosamine kinase GspK [Pseudoalteromonas sp. CIP111854]CAH9059508.1 Glucosamine kinase GspK [Pseudoalteromonas sp. CIP111951]
MTENTLFLGIDGGGTKCKVRLENGNGQQLAEATSGPANIATSTTQAQSSILNATMTALTNAQLPTNALANLHVYAGFAGANIHNAIATMAQWQHPFADFTFTTDIHIACAGAHQGQDGGVIILGTGFCAGLLKNGQCNEFGGYGLLLSDGASGGWIGLNLVKTAIEVLDKLSPTSTLIEAFLNQVKCQHTEQLVALTLHAPPCYFAQFARLVFTYPNDPYAKHILSSAAHFVERYIKQLQDLGVDKVALIGGVAVPIRSWIHRNYQSSLVTPAMTPEAAAAQLARRQFFT